MPAKRRFTFEFWYEVIKCQIKTSKKSPSRRRYVERRVGFFSSQKLAHKAGRKFGKELGIDAYDAFRRHVWLTEGYVVLPRLVAPIAGGKGNIVHAEDEEIQLTA